MTTATRPSREELVAHYKNGIGKNCLVCDDELAIRWTDYNGQGKCLTCGMTYQVLGSHLSETHLAECGITKADVAKQYCDEFELVPLVRAYWTDKKKPLPLGSYFGHAPWTKEEVESFYGWLRDNAPTWREQYEDLFTWDRIMKIGAKETATA